MSSSHLRRSRRLALKEVTRTSLTREEARTLFLEFKGPVSEKRKIHFIQSISSMVNDIYNAKGRDIRAKIAIDVMTYLANVPDIIASFSLFKNAVINKLYELNSESPLSSTKLDAEFRRALANVSYIITGSEEIKVPVR